MNQRNELIPFAFQPIFKAGTTIVYGYEALIRPKLESPLSFIQRMIEQKRIQEMEYLTFRYAIENFIRRQLTGKLFINSFPCENLSREQIDYLKTIFPTNIFSQIVIEVLEYPALSTEQLAQKQRIATELDMLMAIDDFGTGNNTATILTQIKPDIIKLDYQLTHNISSNPMRTEKMSQLIYKLHQRGFRIVAEGIETMGDFLFFSSRVDYLQGNFLGSPQL